MLLLASGAPLVAQNEDGVDITGTVTDRDNTRVRGQVVDGQGQPLSEVHVWVSNDAAPADRVRARTRKSGTYLVRNFARLYTEDDIYGIVVRVRFEKAGYRAVEAKIAIEKNTVGVLTPVLFAEGEDDTRVGRSALLIGRVTRARGRPVKDATLEVKTKDGSDLAPGTTTIQGAAKKNGEFELFLFDVPRELVVVVRSSMGEKEFSVSLPEAYVPDAIAATEIKLAY